MAVTKQQLQGEADVIRERAARLTALADEAVEGFWAARICELLGHKPLTDKDAQGFRIFLHYVSSLLQISIETLDIGDKYFEMDFATEVPGIGGDLPE